jgi:outer membrane lipopolysaccharide assembly protein LptE/RlpB
MSKANHETAKADRKGMNKGIRPVLLISALIVILLGGCGYSVQRHAALPVAEISLGRIENATFEPKLQDKLFEALTREFMKQGIGVDPSAKLKLTGMINRFDLIGLSEKNGITAEYRVVVNITFRLLDEEGKTRKTMTIDSPFIVSFTGSPDLGALLATKEVAEERAMADIAMELVGQLIYK